MSLLELLGLRKRRGSGQSRHRKKSSVQSQTSNDSVQVKCLRGNARPPKKEIHPKARSRASNPQSLGQSFHVNSVARVAAISNSGSPAARPVSPRYHEPNGSETLLTANDQDRKCSQRPQVANQSFGPHNGAFISDPLSRRMQRPSRRMEPCQAPKTNTQAVRHRSNSRVAIKPIAGHEQPDPGLDCSKPLKSPTAESMLNCFVFDAESMQDEDKPPPLPPRPPQPDQSVNKQLPKLPRGLWLKIRELIIKNERIEEEAIREMRSTSRREKKRQRFGRDSKLKTKDKHLAENLIFEIRGIINREDSNVTIRHICSAISRMHIDSGNKWRAEDTEYAAEILIPQGLLRVKDLPYTIPRLLAMTIVARDIPLQAPVAARVAMRAELSAGFSPYLKILCPTDTLSREWLCRLQKTNKALRSAYVAITLELYLERRTPEIAFEVFRQIIKNSKVDLTFLTDGEICNFLATLVRAIHERIVATESNYSSPPAYKKYIDFARVFLELCRRRALDRRALDLEELYRGVLLLLGGKSLDFLCFWLFSTMIDAESIESHNEQRASKALVQEILQLRGEEGFVEFLGFAAGFFCHQVDHRQDLFPAVIDGLQTMFLQEKLSEIFREGGLLQGDIDEGIFNWQSSKQRTDRLLSARADASILLPAVPEDYME